MTTSNLKDERAAFLPCPFCGCKQPPVRQGNGIGDYWLECGDCGASTRLREDGAGNEKDWNRRAAATATATLTEEEAFTLMCAVENLRAVDRSATAAFGIASKLEAMRLRLAASPDAREAGGGVALTDERHKAIEAAVKIIEAARKDALVSLDALSVNRLGAVAKDLRALLREAGRGK